jgi:hypothetical protein
MSFRLEILTVDDENCACLVREDEQGIVSVADFKFEETLTTGIPKHMLPWWLHWSTITAFISVAVFYSLLIFWK